MSHQLASLHDVLGLEPHVGLGRDGSAEHVSGRQVAQAVVLLHLRCLGSLARPGRACIKKKKKKAQRSIDIW